LWSETGKRKVDVIMSQAESQREYWNLLYNQSEFDCTKLDMTEVDFTMID